MPLIRECGIKNLELYTRWWLSSTCKDNISMEAKTPISSPFLPVNNQNLTNTRIFWPGFCLVIFHPFLPVSIASPPNPAFGDIQMNCSFFFSVLKYYRSRGLHSVPQKLLYCINEIRVWTGLTSRSLCLSNWTLATACYQYQCIWMFVRAKQLRYVMKLISVQFWVKFYQNCTNDGRTNFDKRELKVGIWRVKKVWIHMIYKDRSEHKVCFGTC